MQTASLEALSILVAQCTCSRYCCTDAAHAVIAFARVPDAVILTVQSVSIVTHVPDAAVY